MQLKIGLDNLLIVFTLIGCIVGAFKFILIPFSDYIKNNAINKYEMDSMKKDIEDLEKRVFNLENNNKHEKY